MKGSVLLITVSISAALAFAGCAQSARPMENSQAAIDSSKTIKDIKAQAQYLLDQGNMFLSSNRFEDALNTAKYVLNLEQPDYVAKAQAIIDRAQAELQKFAQQKMDEAKGAAEGKMQEIKGAIGNIGK